MDIKDLELRVELPNETIILRPIRRDYPLILTKKDDEYAIITYLGKITQRFELPLKLNKNYVVKVDNDFLDKVSIDDIRAMIRKGNFLDFVKSIDLFTVQAELKLFTLLKLKDDVLRNLKENKISKLKESLASVKEGYMILEDDIKYIKEVYGDENVNKKLKEYESAIRVFKDLVEGIESKIQG